jgi:predicted GIY-YIG superfamily endonuclease
LESTQARVSALLAERVEAHRNGCVDGFTRQYGVHTLVYFEEMNPEWKDLFEQAF